MLLKCGLRNECYQTCGLTHVTKCGLKSVLFFCGLDFVCALSNMRSSNKNVVLTQRYPKHAVLKVPISHSTKSPPFAQHIFIDLATCHYSLTPSPLIVVAPHSLKLTPNFAIFQKFPLFGSCTRKSTFSPGPKIPLFQRPRTRRILELQTCKQGF